MDSKAPNSAYVSSNDGIGNEQEETSQSNNTMALKKRSSRKPSFRSFFKMLCGDNIESFTSFQPPLDRTIASGSGNMKASNHNLLPVKRGSSSDPHPGRCGRTDGRKWRCAKDAVTGKKYCEKHKNVGRPRKTAGTSSVLTTPVVINSFEQPQGVLHKEAAS
ncbi:growth-regulating factor 9-like [Euphorbia lathyris]|uniref:growth-regulating factor 9-like n=1 Tax=Euphorbia lathyris TaxID=212925 RepID=UPI0033137534